MRAFIRLIGYALFLAFALTLGLGGFFWWYGGRVLPEDIDRIKLDEAGNEVQFAGEYEGFTNGTLATGILSASIDVRQGRRVAVLSNDIGYISYQFEGGLPESTATIYIVPRYFVTDFASIPWPASYLISPFGDHAEAAVVHDWLYALGSGADPEDAAYREKWREARLNADLVFYNAMRESGVSKWRRRIMFGAVRFGGRSFGKDREWFGDGCDAEVSHCEAKSRFFEPFVGVSIPDRCLPVRDPKAFSPKGTVSSSGVSIKINSEHEGEMNADIGQYVDGLWEAALSSEACYAFLSERLNTKTLFKAVKDPDILSIQGPITVSLASIESFDSIEHQEAILFDLPDDVMALVTPAMERLFGHADIRPVQEQNDFIRRQSQREALANILSDVETARFIDILQVYNDIERRGDEVLSLVPNRGYVAGNFTARSVDMLFSAAVAYAAASRETRENLFVIEDRYFDNPVTQKVYETRKRNVLKSEFTDELNAVLPE